MDRNSDGHVSMEEFVKDFTHGTHGAEDLPDNTGLSEEHKRACKNRKQIL